MVERNNYELFSNLRYFQFSHLLFVGLFTVIMLSMNRIEIREKKFGEVNQWVWNTNLTILQKTSP